MLRWDQVSEVREREKRVSFRGRYTGTVFTYTLQLVDGRTFIFTSLIKDVEDLGMSLWVNIVPVLLSKAMTALDAGQIVPFGQFSASPTGISDGKQFFPWQDVKGIVTSEKVVSIQEQGRMHEPLKAKASTITNLAVLVELVNSMIFRQEGNQL